MLTEKEIDEFNERFSRRYLLKKRVNALICFFIASVPVLPSSYQEKTHSEIIQRLYLKLLPVQIVLVLIGGVNGIIDNAFAGNLIGQQAMAVTLAPLEAAIYEIL